MTVKEKRTVWQLMANITEEFVYRSGGARRAGGREDRSTNDKGNPKENNS
jgi:hypothetical protein